MKARSRYNEASNLLGLWVILQLIKFYQWCLIKVFNGKTGCIVAPIQLPECWSLTSLTILIYKITVLTYGLIKFVQGPLDLYTDLSQRWKDVGPWLPKLPEEHVWKILGNYTTVSRDLHTYFSTFLYCRWEFGNNLVILFELCRAYRWYKFMGRKYDLKRQGKQMSVWIKFPVNIIHV